MHRRILNLRDSSVSQSRDCSMAVTLLYLLYVLYTYRAALRCTLSIRALSLASQGDHTEAAYSTCGRTSDLYALSRTSLVDFRFRLRTFRVLVAFAATCLQWTSHLRLFVISHQIFRGSHMNFELDCGECTRARSQWEGCIQSKSTWLMFIYLFSLRRWKCLGSIQCKHLEYTAYFWKGNIRIYANLVG